MGTDRCVERESLPQLLGEEKGLERDVRAARPPESGVGAKTGRKQTGKLPTRARIHEELHVAE